MSDEAARHACSNCDGNGWVYDNLGGCGDPECCGGPAQVKCMQCVNDWGTDLEQNLTEGEQA